MEDIARGVLAGVAIGGFAAVVVKVNMFTIDKLSMLNNLAIETAINIGRAALEDIQMKRRRRRLGRWILQQISEEQELTADEAKLEEIRQRIREDCKQADAESES